MVKLEDLHIGDKVRTTVCDNIAEVVKIESISYINYQIVSKRADVLYSGSLLHFANDNNRHGGIIYNCVTLNITTPSLNMLIGTDITNIIEIIKPINNNEHIKKESFIKRLFKKIF